MPLPLAILGLIGVKVGGFFLYEKAVRAGGGVAFEASQHLALDPNSPVRAVFKDPLMEQWMRAHLHDRYHTDVRRDKLRIVFHDVPAAEAFLRRWEP